MRYDPRNYLKVDYHFLSRATLKVLGEGGDYNFDLPEGQMENGSWNDSVPETFTNLYHFSLFTNEADERIIRALDWLFEKHHEPFMSQNSDGCSYDYLLFRTSKSDNEAMRKMKTVPFTNGCSGFIKTGATLFLATHFGIDDDFTRRIYSVIDKLPNCRKSGWYCSSACGNNIFQAIAKHPEFSKRDSVDIALKYLERHQKENGDFEGSIPFYPVFNALSRIELPRAEILFDRAMTKIEKRQHKDGAWGKSHKQIHTYLVIDALIRKGIVV